MLGGLMLVCGLMAIVPDRASAQGATGVVVDVDYTVDEGGYWITFDDGRVKPYGAPLFGDRPTLLPGERVSALSPTPTGAGYWLFTDRGRVHVYGDAPHWGDLSTIRSEHGVPVADILNGPVVGSSPTPTGAGYWMVASDGGIFAFGDAKFYGSMGGTTLNGPVVGLAPTPSNRGYWLVATDGGIFAFGDAGFYGSMGGSLLNAPISSMIPQGEGYMMVASDGGIFNFGVSRFLGSLGGQLIPAEITAAAARKNLSGYLLVDTTGRTYPFGDATDTVDPGTPPNLGDPALVEHHCGEVNGVWSPQAVHILTCPVQVVGVLRIEAGSIVKVAGDGIRVVDGGRVEAAGTAENPVIITSRWDDDAGGDSNGDGETERPRSVGALGVRLEGGEFAGRHVEFGDLTWAVQNAPRGCCTSHPEGGLLDVSDSRFGAPVELLDGPAPVVAILRRNVFSVAEVLDSALTLGVDPTAVAFAGPDANRFEGVPRQRLVELDVTVPAGRTFVLSPAGGAIFATESSSGFAAVQVAGVLRIEAGSIVKVAGDGIRVVDGGRVEAAGTAENPVIITSRWDDDAGGDSNGDGETERPRSVGALGVRLEGGEFAGRHVEFGDLTWAVQNAPRGCCTSHPEGGLLDVSDSRFGAPVELLDGPAPVVAILRRNVFSVAEVLDSALTLGVDPTAVAFAGPDANRFEGVPRQRLVELDVTVPAGRTFVLSPAGGAIFATESSSGFAAVQVAGVLRIEAGSIVKVAGDGIRVVDGGRVEATGTAENPVIITSRWDDDAGGDTLGDSAAARTRSAMGIHLDTTSRSNRIVGTVFRHLRHGIRVSVWANAASSGSYLDVVGNKFSSTDYAVSVESLQQTNPVWASLPCVPPFANYVRMPHNWFGESGSPGLRVELSDVATALPAELSPVAPASTAILSEYVDFDPGTDNALNYALFSCPPLLPVPVPVFPVTPFPTLSADPFPEW